MQSNYQTILAQQWHIFSVYTAKGKLSICALGKPTKKHSDNLVQRETNLPQRQK